MVRGVALGLAAACATSACGLDLDRNAGALTVSLVGLPAESTIVTIQLDHRRVSSEVHLPAAAELFVESVPAGRSWVSAAVRRPTPLASNRLLVRVYEGEMRRVGLTAVDDPDADPDADGLSSRDDNCPYDSNPQQEDGDRDGLGDACDNCLAHDNPAQDDLDIDGYGDLCDPDTDGDGVLDVLDACPRDPSGHIDQDLDGVCEPRDNCPTVFNPTQGDCDRDTKGDACDTDIDQDGILNGLDNCPFAHNPNQTDSDNDGVGDACADDPSACRLKVG